MPVFNTFSGALNMGLSGFDSNRILDSVAQANFATRILRLRPLIELLEPFSYAPTVQSTIQSSSQVILTEPNIDPLDKSFSLLQTFTPSLPEFELLEQDLSDVVYLHFRVF